MRDAVCVCERYLPTVSGKRTKIQRKRQTRRENKRKTESDKGEKDKQGETEKGF